MLIVTDGVLAKQNNSFEFPWNECYPLAGEVRVMVLHWVSTRGINLGELLGLSGCSPGFLSIEKRLSEIQCSSDFHKSIDCTSLSRSLEAIHGIKYGQNEPGTGHQYCGLGFC